MDFNDQKRGRLTLIRDLLDRLPDTNCEPPAFDFAALDIEPLDEDYRVLKPIDDFQID